MLDRYIIYSLQYIAFSLYLTDVRGQNLILLHLHYIYYYLFIPTHNGIPLMYINTVNTNGNKCYLQQVIFYKEFIFEKATYMISVDHCR